MPYNRLELMLKQQHQQRSPAASLQAASAGVCVLTLARAGARAMPTVRLILQVDWLL